MLWNDYIFLNITLILGQIQYNPNEGASNWLYKRPSFHERIRNLGGQSNTVAGQQLPAYPTFPASAEAEYDRPSSMPINPNELRNQWRIPECISYLYYILIILIMVRLLIVGENYQT